MSDKFGNESFWDFGDKRKNSEAKSSQSTARADRDTSTATVVVSHATNPHPVSQSFSDSSITKFIPPKSDSAFKKKHVIFEYQPDNPFIKNVKILSEKDQDSIFDSDNLFMRTRAALIDRTVYECEYAPFYSYSPRYSQLTKPQLKYYLWWRENVRHGVYLKTDESYVMLYVYELAATPPDEDTQKALSLLCSILRAYPQKPLNIMTKTMIRDIICDFCLIHGLTPPADALSGVEPQVINNSFLPEVFVNLNTRDDNSIKDILSASASLYDYKKSKYYTPENASIFDTAITECVKSIINNDAAFDSITSFTRGVYGAVTSERRPFQRMVNIVNKSVSVEVTYFALSNVRPAITDIVRYSENKLREHLGIKNKISIMAVNPVAKGIIDSFFENRYPPRPTVDRRRRDARLEENESAEYYKLYDVPKTEISPERALEIERQSWDTTKILTEAFSNEDEYILEKHKACPEPVSEPVSRPIECIPDIPDPSPRDTSDTFESIRSTLGEIADFIKLCTGSCGAMEQRRFASSHSMGVDEIADSINEEALNVVGDIILESDGVAYAIIEDYKQLFQEDL